MDDLRTPLVDLPMSPDWRPAVDNLAKRCLVVSGRAESCLLLVLSVLFEPVTLVLLCALETGRPAACGGGVGLRLMLGLSEGDTVSRAVSKRLVSLHSIQKQPWITVEAKIVRDLSLEETKGCASTTPQSFQGRCQ